MNPDSQSFFHIDLARRALTLTRSNDLGKILRDFHKIFDSLAAASMDMVIENDPIATIKAQKKWVQNHPIMHLLAHKLKNTVCMGPEQSYRRAESIVTDLAQLSE